MIVIIDGYNFLRAMFPKIRGRLDKQRNQLIKSLGIYKSKKDNEIVVVFDGGLFNHASREVHAGVAVVFSGHKRSADDWIVEYAKRNYGKEILLVSSDRELRSRCKRYDVDAVGVMVFSELLENTLVEEIKEDLKQHGEAVKLKHGEEELLEEIDSAALDVLMEQATIHMEEKKEEKKTIPKKGADKEKSRKEKKLERKIGKL